MNTKADLAKLSQMGDKYAELFRLTQQGVRSVDQVLEMFQNAIEGKFPQSELAPDLFVSGEQQLENVKVWSRHRDWGFTDSDFEQAKTRLASITQPTGRLTTLVLVPYLDTVQWTFDELWQVAATHQPNKWRSSYLKGDSDHLRLLEGITHQCGLRWETIELDANRGKAPADVRDQQLAHAGLLAAAAHFPNWVQAMDGKTVPYVWMAGYQVSIPGYEAWRDVPSLNSSQADREVDLYADWDGGRNANWAVPVRREC